MRTVMMYTAYMAPFLPLLIIALVMPLKVEEKVEKARMLNNDCTYGELDG